MKEKSQYIYLMTKRKHQFGWHHNKAGDKSQFNAWEALQMREMTKQENKLEICNQLRKSFTYDL